MVDLPEGRLRELYHDRGMTQGEIGGELGMSQMAVSVAMRERDIETTGPGSNRVPELRDAEWLQEQYHGAERTQADIADELGCTRDAVACAMKRHGIETRFSDRYDELHDEGWLRERYVERGMTQAEIADEVGCSTSAVSHACRRHGLS